MPSGARYWMWFALYKAGHPAVILFFVLSGFALSLSYLRGTEISYFSFIIKRVLRIYPTLLASLCLSAALYWVVSGFPRPHPDWFDRIFITPPSAAQVARNLALLAVAHRDTDLNGVIWSLAYEVRISALFPLVVAIARLNSAVAALTGIALYFTSSSALYWLGVEFPPILGGSAFGAASITIYYIPCFIFGVLIAKHILDDKGAPPLSIWIEPFLIAACINAALWVNSDLAATAASGLLIFIVIRGSISSRIMLLAPLRWLGRVSYSLYLCHWPILATVAFALYGRVSIFAIVGIAITLSLMVSEVFFRTFEAPSIRIGRNLSKRVPALAANWASHLKLRFP